MSDEELTISLDRLQAKLLQAVIAHGRHHLTDISELDAIINQLEDFTESASLVFHVPRFSFRNKRYAEMELQSSASKVKKQ